MANKIDSFSGEFAFLSNFHPSVIEMQGIMYPTVEHAFQAFKSLDDNERKQIASARTPGVAKRMGQKVKLRPFWDSLRLNVMEMALREKFKIPELAEKLLATGDAELIEGNTWGDKFWGQVEGEGKNHLGKLLMKIRKEVARWKSLNLCVHSK